MRKESIYFAFYFDWWLRFTELCEPRIRKANSDQSLGLSIIQGGWVEKTLNLKFWFFQFRIWKIFFKTFLMLYHASIKLIVILKRKELDTKRERQDRRGVIKCWNPNEEKIVIVNKSITQPSRWEIFINQWISSLARENVSRLAVSTTLWFFGLVPDCPRCRKRRKPNILRHFERSE